jgi:glycosyltransferase involved in cell wall biosynthesis
MARRALRGAKYEALLFHTHVPALLCPDHLRRAPALLSVDATPAQNARLGIYVGSSQRYSATRYLTGKWVSATLRRSHRVIAWSDGVRRSLIEEYGLQDEQIEVLPPGIDIGLWQTEPGGTDRHSGRGDSALPRILFVGGDLRAKGGRLLLECFRRHWRGRAELHLVTRTPLPDEPGVIVHRWVNPNSADLRGIFHKADIFALPTYGDAFPQVVLEAMAAGLPVVASSVGGIPEMVEHDQTGLVVPAGDIDRLAAAVESLLDDRDRRRLMGQLGHERAREHFDIARNGRRLMEILIAAREGRR